MVDFRDVHLGVYRNKGVELVWLSCSTSMAKNRVGIVRVVRVNGRIDSMVYWYGV